MEKRLMTFIACLFLSLGMALAQTQVSGKVTSAEDGEPVIGASIKVVGTKIGAVTDIEGNFSLTAPEGAKLEISYIGMNSQTVKAGSNMKIVLNPDNKTLDEVVVTGYGNFKKSSFTGSASTLNTQGLEDIPVVSLTDKLSGGVPGVSVSGSSSAPGAVSSIRVRGMGSINAGNEPLYVIDGTPMNAGNASAFNSEPGSGYNDAGTSLLATLNSNDIESITVIKDAAAASLYGSRAANGVVVITTKSGKAGKTNVEFRSDWGFSNMAVDYRPQLSGADRRELLYTGLKNYAIYKSGKDEAAATTFADGQIDRFAAEPENGYTDWKDLLFRTGNHANYQVSVSGGSEKTKFYSSVSYMKQEGILHKQGLERFTGNASVSHDFGKFNLRVNSQFSKMNQSLVNEGTSYAGAIANYAFFQSPSSVPYDSEGNLTQCGMNGVNPLYEQEHSSDKNVINRALNSMQLTYNVWDNLKISEKVSYDYINSTETVLWDRFSNDGAPGGVAQRMINEFNTLNTQTQASYNKSFGEHNVDALLGFETEDYHYTQTYLSGESYPGDKYEFENANSTSTQTDKQGYRLTSFLGRVNYNYADKYYFGVSYRRDGSSRLARENRWGDFWSLSGSWRFTSEKFMDPIKDVLTDGKIRVSYGVNGTQPSVYYGYKSWYKWGFFYNGTNGSAISGIANENLKWEKNKALNIGIDLNFWNRLSLTFDYYTRTTSDLIFDLPVSAVPGYFSSPDYALTSPQNVGELKNTGYEVTITSNNFNTKDFTWTTTLNLAHNSNKVSKLYGGQNQIINGILIHKEGEPYYSYYTYEYAGVDPETGQELYYKNDGTGETTTKYAEANKTIVGNHDPAIEGGLTNTLRYKFIDFGMTLTFSLGGDAMDYATWQHSNGGSFLYSGAVPAYYKIEDMWQKPGDNAKLPKFQYGSTTPMSSRWMMSTDYLRIKSLSIGFNVPKSFISQLGLSKARAYFAASNLLTWKSKDLTVDPEVPVDGLCTFETPALRTFTFGIELGF